MADSPSNRQHLLMMHMPHVQRPKSYLRCPDCGSTLSRVIATRAGIIPERNITGVARIRRCHKCATHYRTLETIIKDDGSWKL